MKSICEVYQIKKTIDIKTKAENKVVFDWEMSQELDVVYTKKSSEITYERHYTKVPRLV